MPDTFEQLPSIQQRNLGSLYNTGEPFAVQRVGQEQSQAIGQATPNTPHGQFGMLIAQLLQQYQGLGTKPFVEQELAAREEQNKRIFQTPSNLIGASPSIQAGARAANVGALEPTIQGAVQSQRTFAEQLQFVGDIIKELRAEQKEMRADQKASREAPKTLETDQGILFWNPDTKKFESTGFTKATGGLTPTQINQTVNQIAGAFDNEPIVKNYNTALEGIQTLKSIGVKTISPADDIAFIYGFAKLMDPNSVVREGEYNTIQKYAQTWADTFGFKAKRIFSNTNFLSADAKQKMLNSVQSKFNSIDAQYKNLRKEYQRQVDAARTGQPREITEYTPPEFQGQTFERGGATWRKNSNGTYTRIK